MKITMVFKYFDYKYLKKIISLGLLTTAFMLDEFFRVRAAIQTSQEIY